MKLSVIIPVYNSEHYLCECLDSVLAQTFMDWETICVDDGSTDASPVILDEYARRDSRIRVIHKRNEGAWSARNSALGIADGEWITFVDADDVLNRNWFEEGMRIADKENVDLVRLRNIYGKCIPVDFQNLVCNDTYCVYQYEGVVGTWAWNTFASNGFLWMCFVRHKICSNIEFLPGINCKEDSIWLLEMIGRLKRVAQGEFKGYFYRNTENSLIKRKRKISQCEAYLRALGELWRKQRCKALAEGYLKDVCKNIRRSADNDVIEWVMHRSRDEQASWRVFNAYQKLQGMGALDARYSHRKRYFVGFLWWSKTGQTWLIYLPGFSFLLLRRLINQFKVKILKNI